MQKKTLLAQLDNRRAVAAVSGQVPETLHNIRTIHALGMEAYMEHRYDKQIEESYAAVERTNFYDAIYSPMVFVLNAAVVGVVMLLSASGKAEILALFGMSVGTSVAVIDYISRIFSPIESLGMEIQTIQSAMAGVKRIDAFLSQPEREIPKERESAARGDVVFSHVTFGYGEKPVLRDFSMTVKEGEQVTLAGRTGAGKSTVFRLLLGLYKPESGTITIGGVDVADITDRERRSCIGCVEQHFSRVPGTVLEQITLSDPGVTEEMAQIAAKLAGMDEVIRSLPEGYATVCTDGMFSQGEWQLLSIARAAAANPAVLLLDETPPIWTPKPKPECLLHCAALPGDAPCCPFLIVFMKIWVEEPCILEKVTRRIWQRGCMERELPPYQSFECAEYARFVSFIRGIVHWRQSDSTAFRCINDADNFATKTVYDLFRYRRYNGNSRLCFRNLRLHDWHIIYVCM